MHQCERCLRRNCYGFLRTILGIIEQRKLNCFVRGSITVQLTSCFTGLDFAKPVTLLIV